MCFCCLIKNLTKKNPVGTKSTIEIREKEYNYVELPLTVTLVRFFINCVAYAFRFHIHAFLKIEVGSAFVRRSDELSMNEYIRC